MIDFLVWDSISSLFSAISSHISSVLLFNRFKCFQCILKSMPLACHLILFQASFLYYVLLFCNWFLTLGVVVPDCWLLRWNCMLVSKCSVVMFHAAYFFQLKQSSDTNYRSILLRCLLHLLVSGIVLLPTIAWLPCTYVISSRHWMYGKSTTGKTPD